MTQINNASRYRMLAVCTVGCALETYDFMIYALMAPYIRTAFFPGGGAVQGLLLTFATFGIGYLSRPLGGLVFGHIGDKRGRKKTFAATILIMASATALMGALPVYASLGVLAPILLLILRLIQGLSMGGEVGGALTYAQEIIPEHPTMASGAILCGMIMGMSLGYCVHAGLEYWLGASGMMETGWRLAFFIGGGLGVVGYFIRRHFHETQGFLELQEAKGISRIPVVDLFTIHWPQVFTSSVAIMAHGFTSILILIFFPVWIEKLYPDSGYQHALQGVLLSTAAAVLCLVFGYFADRWKHRLLIISYSLLILLGIPMAGFILGEQTPLTRLTLQAGAILIGMVGASSLWIFSQQFPAHVRYTGSAVSYNIGFALAGGTTPLLATWLISYFQSNQAAGGLLVLAGLCGFTAMLVNHRRNCHKPLVQGSQSETYDQETQRAPNQ